MTRILLSKYLRLKNANGQNVSQNLGRILKESCGGHVSEDSILHPEALGILSHIDRVHQVGGMGRVRAAGRRVAELTGGRVNPEPAWLWDTSGEEREVRESLWHLPLFAALFLFIVDVLVRRVRWFGRRALAWRDVLARSAT